MRGEGERRPRPIVESWHTVRVGLMKERVDPAVHVVFDSGEAPLALDQVLDVGVGQGRSPEMCTSVGLVHNCVIESG